MFINITSKYNCNKLALVWLRKTEEDVNQKSKKLH